MHVCSDDARTEKPAQPPGHCGQASGWKVRAAMSVLYAVSDTHGDVQNYTRLLELTKDADMYAHLGDYVRDGGKLQEFSRRQTFIIKGNGDFSGGQIEATVNLGGVKILLTHGHKYGVKSRLDALMYRALELDCGAAVYGHTHIPAWEPFGRENLYLNPGSVSIPKNDTAHGYMTLENGVFTWKTLSGEPYHTLAL